ncbi:uncharacterized protein LOC124545470 [Schistocerca americana]|uniref:uncharacterized protein LOC124545470 n=1 Tax=Schistocerca americana TaxID=7009 RepID=UPI001F4F6AD9|nr:uncharacterized protein LOC124545470 [Schistocerca americana]
MKRSGMYWSLLLLTMAAVSRGRDARDYFAEARFQYSPSRPEDALIFFIGNAPPLICEPEKTDDRVRRDRPQDDFRLDLPQGYSSYSCSFEGNATRHTNFNLIQNSAPYLFGFSGGRKVSFTGLRMYCTNDSQLPDEYFHLRVQRPTEDRPVKCRLRNDSGMLYLRFPGFPTVVCHLGTIRERYHFNLPGIADEPLKCAFRVYSELPLGDTHTEERLYQSLISGLPTHVDGVRPRVVCFHRTISNGTAFFQLQLQGGATYDCSFPDTIPHNELQPGNTTQA